MRLDYHNTNRESGETLTESRARAARQNLSVAVYFRNRPDRSFTAEEIWYRVLGGGHGSIPLTSARRAVSDLYARGLLRRCPERRMGSFGKLISTWQWDGERPHPTPQPNP